MTNFHSRWIGVALGAGFALAAAGCDQRHPTETAGQKLDRATQEVAASTKEAASKTAAALDDAALTTKVKAALFAEPGLKTLQIEVETHDQVVTLAGSVDTPTLRDRAVTIAGSLDGVRQVIDKLVVKA
jgi:osmotically-inducible protein OsmY